MNGYPKVIVFGAGGFLGEHIIQQLVNNNFNVYAALRTKPKYSTDSFSHKITYYEGDLEDYQYIQKCLEGMDAIIFAAGCNWKPGLAISEYFRGNVKITKKFFTALDNHQDVRVVYTSSMSAIAGSKTPLIFSEISDRSHVSKSYLSPYDWAKIECEQIVLDYARKNHNIVILNPGFMLGPGAFSCSKITTSGLVLRFCQKNFPFYVNGGHSFCDVRDVAKAHVAALTRRHSGHYIVAGHNLSMAEIYRLMVMITSFSSPRQLPVSIAYSLSLLLDKLSWLFPNILKTSYHPDFVKSSCLYYYGESQKSISDLGYNITPIATTLLDTIKYFDRQGLISEDMLFLEAMNNSNIEAIAYLREMAMCHAFSDFLLPRVPEIYKICESNCYLNNLLLDLLSNSSFNSKKVKFQLNQANFKKYQKTLNKLFEYIYFASDDFLTEVL
ncbi:NAD-dependent epimerase/dehydratase family protein [Nostoc sp. CENA67]|uniref:NAD-dependent epimerase/dehydratase family protein n=1 Tax=Amazonocrinis nigriterrae CENA67 TaxID=2794033 RepID=A0A8J7HKP5_9NOST|nr:NAD-dependent epimerase/dehydratase family protein [Amazonocrinis nigriterrae]MBH8561373.1 NAD-dependent epimerase/dehydratase family protein [Amazonocrinis nigriterrae CENA67]